ncbi:unnamed protein product, partial [Nesidiocoris tenuis]
MNQRVPCYGRITKSTVKENRSMTTFYKSDQLHNYIGIHSVRGQFFYACEKLNRSSATIRNYSRFSEHPVCPAGYPKILVGP